MRQVACRISPRCPASTVPAIGDSPSGVRVSQHLFLLSKLRGPNKRISPKNRTRRTFCLPGLRSRRGVSAPPATMRSTQVATLFWRPWSDEPATPVSPDRDGTLGTQEGHKIPWCCHCLLRKQLCFAPPATVPLSSGRHHKRIPCRPHQPSLCLGVSKYDHSRHPGAGASGAVRPRCARIESPPGTLALGQAVASKSGPSVSDAYRG